MTEAATILPLFFKLINELGLHLLCVMFGKCRVSFFKVSKGIKQIGLNILKASHWYVRNEINGWFVPKPLILENLSMARTVKNTGHMSTWSDRWRIV